jgi:hypothetical protein
MGESERAEMRCRAALLQDSPAHFSPARLRLDRYLKRNPSHAYRKST